MNRISLNSINFYKQFIFRQFYFGMFFPVIFENPFFMKRNRQNKTAKMHRGRPQHEQDERMNHPTSDQNMQNREHPIETSKKHGEHRKGK